MNEVDIKSNPLLQSLNINSGTTKVNTETENDLGQDAFLRLMIAQLENQDPLSPAENGEFIAQLAQFSSVEGITNLNNSLDGLVNEFRSSRALEASALVGRQVEVNSNTGRLPAGETLRGTVELPSSTDNLRITVESLLGEVIRVEEISGAAAGDVAFSWDGLNNNDELQAPGTYRLRATAIIDGETQEVPVRVAANVNSVSVGADNSLTLDVDGVGQLSIDEVKTFL